jgi:Holliday junction resolvase RusA-like endonuclease
MRLVCDITVYGEPAPQGSKNQWGGESSKKVKPWRDRVAQVVGERLVEDGEALLTGAVRCEVTFAFTRPKSHYRTGKHSHELRDDAPFWHTAPNDTDKLQRAIGDALTGTAWKDDKLVSSWSADKIYDDRAYAHIRILDLSGGQSNVGSRSAHPPARTDPVVDPGPVPE